MKFTVFCLILTVLANLCQSNDGNDDDEHFIIQLSPVTQEQGKDSLNEGIVGEYNCLAGS